MILETSFFPGAGAVIVDDKRREFGTSIVKWDKTAPQSGRSIQSGQQGPL